MAASGGPAKCDDGDAGLPACPKCSGRLHTAELTGVQIEQCDQCNGIWFDFGELEHTLSHEDISRLKTAVTATSKQDELRATCPRCRGGNMIRLKVRHAAELHIDACPTCYGQWLDGGELDQLGQGGSLQTIADFLKNMI